MLVTATGELKLAKLCSGSTRLYQSPPRLSRICAIGAEISVLVSRLSSLVSQESAQSAQKFPSSSFTKGWSEMTLLQLLHRKQFLWYLFASISTYCDPGEIGFPQESREHLSAYLFVWQSGQKGWSALTKNFPSPSVDPQPLQRKHSLW